MKIKRKGCSIIFINSVKEILLFLRDDKPTIPYPNKWDFLGGHIEVGETAKECIVREIKEEINLDLDNFNYLFKEHFDDRVDYIFWQKLDLEAEKIKLMEGQKLQWFNFNKVKEIDTVDGLNQIIEHFRQIVKI